VLLVSCKNIFLANIFSIITPGIALRISKIDNMGLNMNIGKASSINNYNRSNKI
jgi:hypothetical protein